MLLILYDTKSHFGCRPKQLIKSLPNNGVPSSFVTAILCSLTTLPILTLTVVSHIMGMSKIGYAVRVIVDDNLGLPISFHNVCPINDLDAAVSYSILTGLLFKYTSTT